MPSWPTQHQDETHPGYQPIRALLPPPNARGIPGVQLKRLRKAEREARIPAWAAHYAEGGPGWDEAWNGALEVFDRRGRDRDALEEAAEWAGWELDYLAEKFDAAGIAVLEVQE